MKNEKIALSALVMTLAFGFVFALNFIYNPDSRLANTSFDHNFALVTDTGDAPATALAPVKPPTGLTTTISGRNIVLNWTAPSDPASVPATGYVPYRDGLPLATTSGTTVTDSSPMVPRQEHCYSVASADADGHPSEKTATVCASLPIGSAVPPTDLAAVMVQAGGVDLTWNYVLTAEQWQRVSDPLGLKPLFIIERSADNGSSWNIVGSVVGNLLQSGPTKTQWHDPNAQTGTAYKYRVTAYDNQSTDSNGQILGWSTPSNVTVPSETIEVLSDQQSAASAEPADTTAPVIQVLSPSGTLASTTTSVIISITTDENATCRYSTTTNKTFANMVNYPFSSTGALNHTKTITGLSAGNTYTYYVRCEDVLHNANQTDKVITFSIEAATVADNTPPVIRLVSPSSTLASSTATTTLSVATDENATCRYSIDPGTAYSAMSATPFTTTGGTTHSKSITGLSSGDLYIYYVRCQDTHSNANSTDFVVQFSVASALQSNNDSTLPSVYMLNPIPGDIFYQTRFELQAAASDAGGIRGVTFYLDDEMVRQEDTVAPYKVAVDTSIGSHSVYAVAYDLAGNMKKSPVVNFTVAQDPSTIVTPLPIYDPLIIQTSNNNYNYNFNNRNTNITRAPVAKKPRKKSLPAELTRNLKLKDDSNEVLLLQRTLNLLGYTIADSGKQSLGNEDGVFDEATKEALIRYQASYEEGGIKPTGVLDNATLALMNSDIIKLVAKADREAEATQEAIDKETNKSDTGGDSKASHFIRSFFGYIYDSIAGIFK